MQKERIRLLIIEDDEDDLLIAQRLLDKAAGLDVTVTWARTFDEGFAELSDSRHDVALVDYRLGARDGLELLREAEQLEHPPPIILLTGQGDREVDLQAMAAGAADYLVKWNVDAQGLERSIRYTLERQRAEDALRESEARYRLLAENISDMISTHTPGGIYQYASPASRTLFGYEPEELIGQPIFDFFHEDDLHAIRASHDFTLDQPEHHTVVHRLRKKDGNYVWVETTSRAVRDGRSGDLREIIAATRDITERRHAEQRIREQAALLDEARDAIIATDLDGHVVYWNKSAERLTGFTADEMMGNVADGSLYGDHPVLAEAHRTVREQGAWSGELRQQTRDGGEAIVESRWTLVRDEGGRPSSVLIINTDVTDQRALQTQFYRAQRMESIGRLVSGIAHDLGNLLVPVLLGAKVMQQRYADDEKAQRTLGMMLQSAQRGSDMVKQVLAFARGVEGERVPLDLGLVVAEVERITTETFPKDIMVEVELPETLWRVKGDATQLQQVLMNLCVNARDAMPEGGHLSIRAENLELTEVTARANLEAHPGQYVRLLVADTGAGIPDQVLDKVFEPFFTTKSAGKGTGLGLSTVYSIIRSHGGFVTVYSEVGEGTAFYIYLPVADTQEPVASGDEPDEAMANGHGELVLVVDDEDFIRETTQEMLEDAGYRVITAEDGEVALTLFDAQNGAVAAVVTDMVMPRRDGMSLIAALRERTADMPIVATSGMPDSKAARALEAGADRFLSKPFSAEKLLGVLQRLLARERDGVVR